jgi:hypothetical protein
LNTLVVCLREAQMNRSTLLKIAVSMVAFSAATVFAQNQAARWQKLLTNMMLSNVDAGTVKDGGVAARAGETQTGVGSATDVSNLSDVAGSNVMKLHLCSDRSFVLTTEASASLPGMTPVSSTSKITGTWTITQATQVDAKVKLTPRKPSDASTLKAATLQTFAVSFTGDRTFVNQTRWYRMRSSICK